MVPIKLKQKRMNISDDICGACVSCCGGVRRHRVVVSGYQVDNDTNGNVQLQLK